MAKIYTPKAESLLSVGPSGGGGASVQMGHWKEGGTNAVAVPGNAKYIAKFVKGKQNILPGGSKHVPAVGNTGHAGYTKGQDTYVGGDPYGNRAMQDGSRLPTNTTYTEWDVNPYTGTNRGQERVVLGADGKMYYTGDHYHNFTEFT